MPCERTALRPSGRMAGPLLIWPAPALARRVTIAMWAVCPSGEGAVATSFSMTPFAPGVSLGAAGTAAKWASSGVSNITLFAGAAREHQGLAGADGGVVVHDNAIERGLGLGIEIEAVAKTPADLADGTVPYGQLLEVRP